jgi:hypothetical protein
MVLQTPHGRHRGHTRVGGVESLTGLRNQTRERLTAGCLIESAFLQYRRLTRWIAYLLGGASPKSPRIGSEAFGEAGAFFWPVLGSGKKVAYRAGNTANVKMVTTNGPPVMANTWSPERRRVEQRQPTRGVLAVSLDSGCRRRVYKLVCRSLIRLVGGAGRRGNGGRFVERPRTAIPRRPRSQAIACADQSLQRVLWESRTTRVGALVSGTYWRSWRRIDWPSSNSSRVLQSLNGDTTRSFPV